MTANETKIRDQLLKLMSASKAIIDARRSPNHSVMDAAVVQLQSEYVKAIVLMKSMTNSSKIPALLKSPDSCPIERQLINMKDDLAVDLGDL